MKRRKGYINVDVSTDVEVDVMEIISEISDEDLMEELKDRKLTVKPEVTHLSVIDQMKLDCFMEKIGRVSLEDIDKL